MQLDRIKLAQRLKEQLDPHYLVYGRELFLVERCCTVIREQAKTQGYSERIVLNATVDFDWKTLSDQLNEQSLFATQKLIELRMPPSGRPGVPGAAALTECLQSKDTGNIVVVIAGALDAAARKSKWFTSWQKDAVVVDNPLLNFKQFQDWIRGYLDRNKIRYEREVVGRLAYYFEGNMLAAANEIRKLCLNFENRRLTLGELERAVVDQAQFNVFALTDACLNGHSERAVRLLRILRNEGAEPVVILLTLAREARLVYKIAIAIDNRDSLSPIYNQYRVWRSRETMISGAARRLGVVGSTHLVRQLARMDRVLKGRDDPPVGGSIWFEFERLILGMCGVRTVR